MKTYITVPPLSAHRAKALGAQWDMARRSWFVPDAIDLSKFSEWLPPDLRKWCGALPRPSATSRRPTKVRSA